MKASAEIAHTELQPSQRFSLREAARILEVPEARLRAFARAGLLAPQRGPLGPVTFGFQDLLLLRTTKGLLESGIPMRRIRRIWASLREQLAANLPLTSISIRTDGEEVLATDGRATWRPDSGQFLLDFEASEIAERAGEAAAPPGPRLVVRPEPVSPPGDGARTPGPSGVTLRGPWGTEPPDPDGDQPPPTAEEWFEAGCALEATEPERAREAFAHAIDLDPGLAEAHVNLGRLLHVAGEPGRAEPHYREAVRLDPEDPTPHFNLGVLLEEQGRRDEAILAYRQAVLRDPDFADAHCNLGLLLDSLGRRQEAMRHLMAANKLGDEGE